MIALYTSKTTSLGRNRFALDCGIGARWHSIDSGPLITTDPTLVNVGGIWQPKAAPYDFRFGADKSRRIYPDKTDLGRYLDLPMPAVLQGLDPVVADNEIIFTASNGRFQVIIATGIQGMSFRVIFSRAPLFQSIKLPIETVGGLDILTLLTATSGLGIPRPRLVDANDVERPLAWQYANGELSLDLDFSGLTFPVTLYNTTLDLQVGASADDGFSASDGTFGSGNTTTSAGYNGGKDYDSWHRFINITMSGTINVAYINWLRNGYVGTPSLTIAAEDAAAPTNPTSRVDHAGRPRTTATTAYSPADPGSGNWNTDNPNIVGVIQELVNSYTYDGNDPVSIFLDDAAGTGSNYIQPRAWDYTGNLSGLKLHIEYTAGGTTEYITPTGGITPAGAVVFKPSIFALGGLTPSATLVRKPSTIYAGALTPTGAVQKMAATSYTGALSLAGALVMKPQIVLSGAITATGELVKGVAAIYVGTITPTGNLIHAVALALTGVITPSGNLVKSVSHTVTGALTPAGAVTLMITLTLAHYLSLARKIFRI